MTRRAPRLVVWCALAAFGVTQWWTSDRIGSWSEETSTYPGDARARLLATPDGGLALDSCAGAARMRIGSDRPVVAFCAAGRTWPVLGTSYFSTWPYWALGAVLPFDVFALRKLSLLLGIATLVLGFELARRLADARVAAACVAVAALSSPFVVPHSVLLHFETLQLPLVALAAWTALRAEGGVSRARGVAIGTLVGLALAVNVKASFLLVPLVVLAWRTGKLPAFRPGALAALAAALLVPLVPLVSLDLAVPSSGLEGQLAMRAGNVVSRVTSGSALYEPLNAVRFWTDISSYGEETAGRAVGTPPWTYVVPALALGWVAVQLARALWRRAHDALGAALGALIVPYVVVGALLWNQTPNANYAPLHAAFGFASAAAAMAAVRFVAARLRLGERVAALLTVVVIAACVTGAAWNTFRTGDPARNASSTNAVAQRVIASWLEARPGARVVTTTYNLAGVLDGASAGRLRTIDARPRLEACEQRDTNDADPDCLARALADTARRFGRLHVVVPAVTVATDEPAAAHLVPALQVLAERGALHVRRETSAGGVGTGPLIEVWEVRP